jgi:molybdenum cofactor cytidylyltransferase
MRAQTVELREAKGRILCCTIFRSSGRKLLPKGHVISDEDVRMLETEGLGSVWVTSLEEGEVGEEDAVLRVAAAVGCGSLVIRLAAGGRANLFATVDACVLVDDELLRQINCAASLVIATVPNFRFVRAGDRVATIKSVPFAVPQQHLETVLEILRERGPILQVRPIDSPAVAVLYSDPQSGEKARQLFEAVTRQRLERLGLATRYSLAVKEEERSLTLALNQLARSRPSVVLIASTTAPAGPEDTVGRAMTAIGCHLEKYLAPVDPGVLLLFGYADEVPVVSAPGCFRSAKANILDLILPPMLAQYHVSGWEIACLGHGGLLS